MRILAASENRSPGRRRLARSSARCPAMLAPVEAADGTALGALQPASCALCYTQGPVRSPDRPADGEAKMLVGAWKEVRDGSCLFSLLPVPSPFCPSSLGARLIEYSVLTLPNQGEREGGVSDSTLNPPLSRSSPHSPIGNTLNQECSRHLGNHVNDISTFK